LQDVGAIQSLINNDVNILVLTATATHEIVKNIFECLSMNNFNVDGLTLERPNIKFSVVSMPSMAAQELINMRDNTPLFCQTLQQCGDFHVKIKRLLGKNITVPPGPVYFLFE